MDDNVLRFPSRRMGPYKQAGRAFEERREAGDDVRTALKAALGCDHELEAAIDAVWPPAERCDHADEMTALLMHLAAEVPGAREIAMQELPHFPVNRAEFAGSARSK